MRSEKEDERPELHLVLRKPSLDGGIRVPKDPRRLVNNIQKLIRSMPWDSEVKDHAPGSLPVSIHKKALQGQPLSLSL